MTLIYPALIHPPANLKIVSTRLRPHHADDISELFPAKRERVDGDEHF
ncbi:hypothetical protein [Burkholderia pyrrocinia]